MVKFKGMPQKLLIVFLATCMLFNTSCSMDESADDSLAQDSSFLGEEEGSSKVADELSGDESLDEETDDLEASNDDSLDDSANDELDKEVASSGTKEETSLEDEFADDSDTKTADASVEKSDDLLADNGSSSGDDEFDDFEDDSAEGKSVASEQETAPATPEVTEQNVADAASDLSGTDVADASQIPAEPAEPAEAPQEPEVAASEPPPVDETEAGPKWIPVRKIASVPISKNGRLLNAVYIGRPGDTVEAISQKIFKGDHTSDIVADNPWLSDGIKVGEKLYYNSPIRPQDNTAVMTYYEELSVPQQTYVSKEGDNIRAVSAGLLGYPDAWKEIWATNSTVDSKDEIPSGTALRYWKDDAGAAMPAPVLAQESTAPGGDPSEMVDPSQATNSTVAGIPAPEDLPPLPDPSQGGQSISSNGPIENSADPSGGMPPSNASGLGEPPPPPVPADPLAGDPSQAVAKATEPVPPPAPADDSTMMLLGGAFAIGIMVLLAIRMKKAKMKPAMNMEYTQI